VPLISPYLFDYDFAIFAIPVGLLLSDGFRNGWQPGMRAVLLLAWLAPAAAPAVADSTGLQILPLVSVALFWVAWRRCRVPHVGGAAVGSSGQVGVQGARRDGGSH
jgi:hypothetical protein